MGLFSFIKEAGEKLFGGKEVEAAATQAATDPQAKRSLDALNDKAARAIENYISSQKLGVEVGGTTADGLFTVQQCECLGACADAPVMLVNDRQMCSFMSHERLDELVDVLKANSNNSAKN